MTNDRDIVASLKKARAVLRELEYVDPDAPLSHTAHLLERYLNNPNPPTEVKVAIIIYCYEVGQTDFLCVTLQRWGYLKRDTPLARHNSAVKGLAHSPATVARQLLKAA